MCFWGGVFPSNNNQCNAPQQTYLNRNFSYGLPSSLPVKTFQFVAYNSALSLSIQLFHVSFRIPPYFFLVGPRPMAIFMYTQHTAKKKNLRRPENKVCHRRFYRKNIIEKLFFMLKDVLKIFSYEKLYIFLLQFGCRFVYLFIL